MSSQSPQCNFLSMVAGGVQHILIIYTPLLLVPFSMCSNIFHFADLHIDSHTKKELPGQQQPQLKSSWHLSGLPWHTKHKGFLVMEYAAEFLTWKPRLVYCMYFTVMERCYSYRESKTEYYWSNWSYIYSVSWVSLVYEMSGLELSLFKVLSCLEASFFRVSSELIRNIIT